MPPTNGAEHSWQEPAAAQGTHGEGEMSRSKRSATRPLLGGAECSAPGRNLLLLSSRLLVPRWRQVRNEREEAANGL